MCNNQTVAIELQVLSYWHSSSIQYLSTAKKMLMLMAYACSEAAINISATIPVLIS